MTLSLKKLYRRERYESIRTQFSFLNFTLNSLKHHFWTVFESYQGSNFAPPFIFPTMTFRNLEDHIKYLQNQCLKSNPDAKLADLIPSQFVLEEKANNLLDVLVKLTNALTQRIAGTGIMKQTESHLVSQFEQVTSIKSYQAVDALSYDLVYSTLGSKWIKSNYYIPFSIFDSPGYEIDVYSFVATVPHQDTFRARFWPAMAHEVAHILVDEQVTEFKKREELKKRTGGRLGELLLDATPILLDALEIVDNDAGRQVVQNQLTELFCDVISTYVCPATFITGSLSLPYYFEDTPQSLIYLLRTTTHPPTDARLVAMMTVLEKNGILKADPILSQFANSVMSINAGKNILLIHPQTSLLLESYNQIAKTAAELILKIIPELGVKGIKVKDWKKLQNASNDYADLCPNHLINIMWMKKLEVIKSDMNLDLVKYFLNRKSEPQLLEDFIDFSYQYYVNEIVPKVRGGKDDLCINVS